MARCVWALDKDEITEHICRIDDQDAKGWLATVMQSLKHEDLIRVTVILWAIWYARRKAIHEDIYQSPLSTHNFVTSEGLTRCSEQQHSLGSSPSGANED
jgi:hypothetical protein